MNPAERFDRYQQRCLYDPDAGFYAAGGRAGGARGDFLTSPEVGPLFGTVLAGALRSWWEEAGSPPQWVVAEAGAGRGVLAAAVLAASASGDVPLRYVCVERSAALRAAAVELLGERATVADSLPPRADVLLANELLDNLPVRIVERTGEGWAELWVPEELRPTDLSLAVDVAVGCRLPVIEQAAAWVTAARAVAPRVVTFDYGVATTAELVDRAWLRTYAHHERGSDPFVEPGSVDITVDVAVDQLPAPTLVSTQAEWLERWGIEALVEEGRRVWAERASVGDLAAVRARSRVTEAEALCDPDGLGAFLTLEWLTPPQ
ncbi:MAG: SAM-dependent methyltransferase [Microthrixaceae bacterium]|nr:SAM-dependent methyltransferase [Microthrixaceae bacterium]